MEFLATLIKVGFVDVERMGETGFNSSPKTRGALIRARKPQTAGHEPQLHSKNQEVFNLAGNKNLSTPRAVTTHDMAARALEMGAKKVKVIHTDSIVVEKWVKWKCVYGCPMYGKDGYHPPMTPGIDEVKEVMGEYSRAILLNGEDGQLLTEIACRLEGEAYHNGFYKAFALTALSKGVGSASGAGSSGSSGGT
jgi:hypothetical protein